MTMQLHLRRPRSSWLLTLACALLLVLPPTVAHAAVLTYAQGQGGVGGSFHTQYYGYRSFNRVYHEPTYTWQLWYCQPGGCTSVIWGQANPTVDTRDMSNARAYCYNYSDNSGTVWTCQTSSD